MTINEHLTEFAGKPVANFRYEHDGESSSDYYGPNFLEPPASAGDVTWRVATWFDGPGFGDVFQKFLDEVETAEVTHLVIGYWGASYDKGVPDPVELLVGAAGRLPALRALFLGDIVMEEAEISWIEQSDVTRLFNAFPGLEHLEVRGGEGLELRPFQSRVLRTLRFESGGLPATVVRAVGESDLPALEHLDLWLGTDNYGGDATTADLAGVLDGERLPALRHLGLEDAEIADEVASAVAGAPIVARLESLSLAMGALTDRGAESLLSGQPLTHLRRLDLHHHFLTDSTMDRVRGSLPGVEVDLDEQESPNGDWFYIAVSE
ncbi:STM4015 family protein [Frankia sp. CNm7]|uniref:STM4015 family protein n=1 Tax=Frankia nepalensis TaxID=1836974 RepID=A0A937RBZ4_9ACTN|nr:STM4015 family protein [Frankia nepalensis]MBL7496300.1 STM4015 family protein [Frankia nepalensis]MBL7508503.1 STM4015 family protein [Frankia nepalensis]MBL7520236.1 STM4015 family protein [Frankia nepalensis]MBL7627635.1 STM4015 family protein [Frankia nepalensis]